MKEMADTSKLLLTLKAETSLQGAFETLGSPELLQKALSCSLSWQQRNELTVAGALRWPSLAPQWVATLLALGASVVLENGVQTLAKFLSHGMEQSTLEALQIPVNILDRTWGEASVARTPADPPIVAAVAVVDWAGSVVRCVRLALTGVWCSPVGLAESVGMLVGARMEAVRIWDVATAVQREISPPDDYLGSESYRREMALILTKRALVACRNGVHHQ